MKNILILFALVFAIASCKQNTNSSNDNTQAADSSEVVGHEDEHESESDEIMPNEAGFFGEEFNLEGSIAFEDALAEMGDADSLEVKIHGQVDAVCQVKGCWMTLGDSVNNMRVRFKDYGFFVPMDCMGKTAYISGKMKREIISIEEQKHYLED
ncbi:MAG: DUF4920 domain-containing protein, partial [Bacteroidia bacterium]